MQLAFEILGYATAVAILCVLVAGSAAVMQAVVERWYAGIEKQIIKSCLQDLSIKLKSEAFWFSEHKPTMDLISGYADKLNAGITDITGLRNEWQEQMEAVDKCKLQYAQPSECWRCAGGSSGPDEIKISPGHEVSDE